MENTYIYDIVARLVIIESLHAGAVDFKMFRCMTLLFVCALKIKIKLVNLSVVWPTRLLMNVDMPWLIKGRFL